MLKAFLNINQGKKWKGQLIDLPLILSFYRYFKKHRKVFYKSQLCKVTQRGIDNPEGWPSRMPTNLLFSHFSLSQFFLTVCPTPTIIIILKIILNHKIRLSLDWPIYTDVTKVLIYHIFANLEYWKTIAAINLTSVWEFS